MVTPKQDREFITSLARGLAVVQAFDRNHPELTVSQAAVRTGLNPGVVRRCLLTFQRLGFVGVQDRRYFLLPKIVSLGSSYLVAGRIEEIIQPILRDVVTQAGDSASLAVLDGTDILYIANFAANRLFRLTAGVGTRFPAFATSMGRVLLAGLSPDALDAYFKAARFSELTERTVVAPEALREIIGKARRDGYVAVRDELEIGLRAVAVPVVFDGETVAAINCADYRSDDSEIAGRVELLEKAARQVSTALGDFPVLAESLSYGVRRDIPMLSGTSTRG